MSKEVLLRKDVKDEHKWAIHEIYASNEAFEEDLKALKEKAPVLMEYKGKLHEKEALLSYLKDFETYTRKLENLYVFASMKSHEDTTNNEQQVVLSKIAQYAAEYSAMISYFVPELLSLDEDTITSYLEDEELSTYRFYIQSIVKEKPHVLSPEKECHHLQ